MLKRIGSTVSNLFGGFTLRRTNPQDEIDVSYFVHFNEAYSDTIYCYVRAKDGREALYLCPGYKHLAGVEFLEKKELESLPKKEYKTGRALKRQEATEGFFFRLMREYCSNRERSLTNNKYKGGFKYLTSLYYDADVSLLEAYSKLYDAVKRECDNLGINYEMVPERIIKKKLEIVRAETVEEFGFELSDVTVCHSIDAINEHYSTNILGCTDSRDMARRVADFRYLKQAFVNALPAEFLINSDNLLCALADRNYPGRQEILKNYMEFFISKDVVFELVRHLDELAASADTVQSQMTVDRLSSNSTFMESLESITAHNAGEVTYRYHAAASRADAERILSEGFYSYSSDLGDTSYAEFDVDQILTYGYGNGIESMDDFIIIIGEPKGKDIVEELTPEERELVSIIPRRNAEIGNKPTHKVDKKHIVGFIDKKSETVIFNEEYSKGSQK